MTPTRSPSLTDAVDRILTSATFRNSEVLRKLLKFLADHEANGGDPLKEYSVAVLGLGKPDSYDPRRDAAVRMQTNRLRQKLDEYYASEGKDEVVIVSLAKGSFTLACHARLSTLPAENPDSNAPKRMASAHHFSEHGRLAIACGIVLLLWALTATALLYRAQRKTALFRSMWTPELEEFWRPFTQGEKPLLIAIGDPVFAQFENSGYYTNLSLTNPQSVAASPQVEVIARALKTTAAPFTYYVPASDMISASAFSALLGSRIANLSTVRGSRISWQQLAEDNVILLGRPALLQDRIGGLQLELGLRGDEEGIRNEHPGPNEPAVLRDRLDEKMTADGEGYTLLTRVPGPGGKTELMFITGNAMGGRLAVAEVLTKSTSLLDPLRDRAGLLPRHFQAIFRVKFRDGVPTGITYCMHHLLDERSPTLSELKH